MPSQKSTFGKQHFVYPFNETGGKEVIFVTVQVKATIESGLDSGNTEHGSQKGMCRELSAGGRGGIRVF